jgi:tetratricopeptide (TPR) repeat protein
MPRLALQPHCTPRVCSQPCRLQPPRTTGFTGRDEALGSVLTGLDPAVLTAGSVVGVVCSVAGLAGVGKTELVVQAAHAALDRGWFPGGALFTDLYGYDQSRRVEPGVALDGLLRALGVSAEHIPPEIQDRARLYASILAEFAKRGRRILVVVDNAFSAEQARLLLPTDEATGALVTSRHTLASLDARLLDLDILDLDDAVDLLERVVQASRVGQDLRFHGERAAAEQVAGWCGCLPLALRIVAALLAEDPSRPLAAMAADLAQERTRLDELQYEERAVRAAFELSYRNLEQEQARMFRLLPVNPGPDLGTRAAAVLADGEEGATRRVLEALARAHLVERGVAYGRWRLHDLVLVYAGELAEGDDGQARQAALERLLDHYRVGADAADANLRTLPGHTVPEHLRDSTGALAWFGRERFNLMAVVALAAASGRTRIALSLTVSLAPYLHWQRSFDDAITIGETAVLAARQAGDRYGEGSALNNMGAALREVRRFDGAITAHQQAIDIYREAGDRHGEGIALTNLGNALREVHRFDGAITAHQQAIDIYREAGDRHGEGIALTNLGNTLQEVRRFDEAINAHQQAANILRETGDHHGEGGALNNLGLVLRKVGRFDEAIGTHQQGLAIYRETGDRHREGTALDNLGLALREVRRFDEAITAHQQAIDIYRKASDRHGEATALDNLGNALREVRRFDEAISADQQAIDIYREAGDRHGEGIALTNLGNALGGAPIRRGDLRTPAGPGDLSGNRRPAPRGCCAEQPRPDPAGGAPVRRGDRRTPAGCRHLPTGPRPATRRHCTGQPRQRPAGGGPVQ